MACYYILLTLLVDFITTSCIHDKPTITTLPNEKCMPRPSLVTIESNEDVYFPTIISLSRCYGSCSTKKLMSKKKCRIEKHDIVYVNVWNKLTQENKIIKVENHTACMCKCFYNHSVCSSTQRWSEKECRCNCDAQRYECPLNHQWNPNTCKCDCHLYCKNREKELNSTSCRCRCRPELYMRCSQNRVFLRESD